MAFEFLRAENNDSPIEKEIVLRTALPTIMVALLLLVRQAPQ